MINTKTNSKSRIIFLLIISIGLYACNNRESFSIEKQSFTTDMIIDCESVDCASIEINLLNIIGDGPVAKMINKEIQNTICIGLGIDKTSTTLSIKDIVSQFNTSYQNIRNEFPDDNIPHEATIDCELNYQSDNLISILIDSYVFTGGAHGNGTVSYLNVDTENGKKLSNSDLLKDHNHFKQYVEKIFREQHKIPENESINSTGFFFEDDTFSLPETIGFTSNEVVLYYNQYEINSYAEGPIELRLDKKDVSSFFTYTIL
ncbi:DUF3298 and DUF4163 domain-containing protein [Aquimarina aquimarini]|uniref:DUF3298 and DUF4163 domain-containing protein n=1 Tax=Aquimarina aquimarini TaxID=1191734 RepID=UPI000D54B752|nr:DUF3298 and DUF4163 domain-containing protein [Aquimarina aquimarini]